MPKKNEDSAKEKKQSADGATGVVLKYDISVRSQNDSIVKLQGNVPMPLFLDPAGIHQAEMNFKKIFEALVSDPVKLQVQTKIRAKQQELEDAEAEKEMQKEALESSDVFMLASKPEEKEEPENEEKDDQQQESTDDNPSEGREQGNPEQEHSDGEWEAPGAVSG